MPVNRHVVIILDVNSIPTISIPPEPGDDFLATENHDGSFESKENANTSNVSYNPEVVTWIKEKVLLILSKEAAEIAPGQIFKKFDFSRVIWSFKIFNSSFELNSPTGRKFLPVNNETVELFEKQLDNYLDPSCPSAKKSLPKVNRSEYLSTAIKSVLGDLTWPQPRDSKFGGISSEPDMENRNVIHTLFRVPRNDTELQDFMPTWTSTLGSKDVLKQILPKAFADKMKAEQIQLNFMDMWLVQDGQGLGSDVKWDGITYSRPILRIVHYLSQGMISGFSRAGEEIQRGLPSYGTLLRMALVTLTSHAKECNKTGDEPKKNAWSSNNNRQGSVNGNMKISPDTEGMSSRSLLSVKRETNSVDSLSMSLDRRNKLRDAFSTKDDLRRMATIGIGRPHQRYSDERESVRTSMMKDCSEQFLCKKRKVGFEEERVQMGYSQNEIQDWCINNNRDQGQRFATQGYNSISRIDQDDRRSHSSHILRRSTGTVDLDRLKRKQTIRYSEELIAPADYDFPEYSDQYYGSRNVLRQTKSLKRVRMDEDDEIPMAPPASNRSSYKPAQIRQSAPAALNYKPNVTNGSAKGLVKSRGQMMVEEGLKKFPMPPPKEKEIDNDDDDEESFAKINKDNYFKRKNKNFNLINNRITLLLEPRSFEEIKSDNPIQYLKNKIDLFKDMVVSEEDTCLVSAAQLCVSILGRKLASMEISDVRGALDRILVVPFEELNVLVIRSMKTASEEAAFRECHLQILLKLELFWAGRRRNETEENVTEEVLKILHLIQAYRKEPPIGDFVNDVLVNEYSNMHKKLLLEISHAMKISPSPLLNQASVDSPVPDRRDFDDGCSISSANSSMCGPGDSCSQHPLDNSYSHGHNQSHDSQGTLLRSQSYLSLKNPKRALMISSKVRTQPVPGPNPRIDHRPRNSSHGPSGLGKSIPKPKKVRRNLFDVSATDTKDMKNLISLIPTSPAFARSPSLFKSPTSKKSYSPRSPARMSPFFRAARRSRRRLVLDGEEDSSPGVGAIWGRNNSLSGILADEVICPASPATPQSKKKVIGPGSHHSSVGTSGKSIVLVKESPEMTKSGHSSRLLNRRVDSVSFYSSGADSGKSRCWEKSKAKIVAARIKDTVDLRSALTLNDFELLSRSPNSDIGLEQENKSDDGDEIVPPTPSPKPSSSKAGQDFRGLSNPKFEAVRSPASGSIDLANIEALMSSEILPPSSAILNLSSHAAENKDGSCHLPDTPSKRVQFNLLENLVNTPSPARHMSLFGTPKSILKDLSAHNSAELTEPLPS